MTLHQTLGWVWRRPALLAAPVALACFPHAARCAEAAPKPSAALKSIAIAPQTVTLDSLRDEQGLIVTGTYADGTVRDLTRDAKYQLSNPRVATVATQAERRLIRPLADGPVTVVVSVPGAAPVSAQVEVRNTGRLAPVSFKDEVIPALTKAGCSAGTCHGTPTGKGGFRLSLQGYNPELDYQTIVAEGAGRRVNKADPGRSLLLLKPLAEMPHKGGKRLDPSMPEFDVLVRWITEGLHNDPSDAPTLDKVEILPGKRSLMLPGAKQQIAVMATFSDGSVRDVTSLSKLTTSDEDAVSVSREGLVDAVRFGEYAIVARYQYVLTSTRLTFLRDVPGFKWVETPENNFVDKHAFNRLKLFQIAASPLTDDREFLRRVYTDTIGLLPTADEVRAFETDKSPEKRDRVIDALTARPEFADQWALRWSDVLRVQDETMKETGARAFHSWLRDSFAANKPMDQFVREVITASGPTFANPPANFYRTMKEPEEFSQASAQLFLGVRMACAKCHNHPFERWTQDEYYEFAAFFSQVRNQGGPGRDEENIRIDPNGEVAHLRTGKIMRPKLLGGEFPVIPRGQDRRVSLANWMTAKDNPFFARAIVNRVWANILGRGLVEPIDDFRESNPAVNEELLSALAEDFTKTGFDLRQLARTILKSRTYQLSSRTVAQNQDDTLYYSHALPRTLSAEQLSDCLSQVFGVPEDFPGYPAGTRAAQIAGTKARTAFLKTFGRPDRNLNCECEREKEPTLFQALALISGRNLDGKLRNDSGRIAKLAASPKPDAEVLDDLYLTALSRHPSANERSEMLSYIAKSATRRQALEDIGWVLVNSKEFLFRH